MADFLATGILPQSTKQRTALLDQCRNQLLTNRTKIMQSTTISKTLTAEFLQWKKSNLSGTAQQFIAHKTKPSPTIAAHAGALDPNNLPRLDNGKLDSLAITNAQNRAKAAELAAASKAVSTKRPPGKIVINRSRYYQPD